MLVWGRYGRTSFNLRPDKIMFVWGRKMYKNIIKENKINNIYIFSLYKYVHFTAPHEANLTGP